MGLLGDVISDVGDIVDDVDDTVDDVAALNVTQVLSDVGTVAGDAVGAVTNVLTNVGKILGATSTSTTPTNPTPTADPTTKPTDPTTKPTDPTTKPTTKPTTPPTSDPTSNPENPTSPSNPSTGSNPGETTASDPSGSSSDGSQASSTNGGQPDATNTVKPNPVALPHSDDPSDGSNGDGSSNGSSGTQPGNGNGNNGGNNGGSNPSGTLTDGDSKHGLSHGAIAAIGIVAAAASMFVLLCLVRCYFIRRRKAKRAAWTTRPTTAAIQERAASWAGGPAAVTPRQSSDLGHEGSRESYHSDTTNESSLFTGPVPLPSWSAASRTQQRRFLNHDSDSSSNENYGVPVSDSRLSWTAQRPTAPPMAFVPTNPTLAEMSMLAHQRLTEASGSGSSQTVIVPAAYPQQQLPQQPQQSDSGHSGEVSMIGGRSESTLSSHLSDYDSGVTLSLEDMDLPARSSTHLSGQFSFAFDTTPIPASTPITSTFGPGISGAATPVMRQAQAGPIAVPSHMVVPSQMPFAAPLPPLPAVLVPSQSPSAIVRSTASPTWTTPAEWAGPSPQSHSPTQVSPRPPLPSATQPRTTSDLFMEADPFASPLDRV